MHNVKSYNNLRLSHDGTLSTESKSSITSQS